MATRSVTAGTLVSHKCAKFIWTGLLNGDDGTPVDWTVFADKSIQVTGTFGAGGNLLLEGSNDGTNWYPLGDTGGTALNVTAAKIKQVLEMTEKVRPRVTAGDGTTSLTVTIVARKV